MKEEKIEKLYNSITNMDSRYIEDALFYDAKAGRSPRPRRISIVLIAAIFALFLMGAGVAAAIYGDSIQGLFSHYWEVITGQAMGEGQTAVIERLSQDIGTSETIGDVTVTVDSATIGYNNLFILLKVKGLQYKKGVEYDFGGVALDIAPDPAQGRLGAGAYGISCRGWDGDGTALMLLEYSRTDNIDSKSDTGPLNISLTLTDILQRGGKGQALEGEWRFDFSLDRGKAIQVTTLPDTEIMAFDTDKNEPVPVVIKNIELSSTGLNFQYDYHHGTISIEDSIQAVLSNGKAVGESGGSGAVMEDGITLNCSHHWKLPINLNDISAIKIGEVMIPVSLGDAG